MNTLKLIFCFLILFSIANNNLNALEQKDVPIIPCAINKSIHRKADIALCAVFRDEGPWLKEWIEFHRLIGVSHFYLYNNCSNDNFWEVLKPYVDEGVIELFDVPFDSYQYSGATDHNTVQVACYNHAIKLSKKYSSWLAIIDLDEFICPVADQNLAACLNRYRKASGLAVYWQIYGTSNIWELKSGELLIEKLLYKYKNTGGNGMFKFIVRPQHATCIDPHYCTLSGGGFAVRPDNQRFSHTPNYHLLPVDIVRINHYMFRTQHYYETFKRPRRQRWGDCPSPEDEQARLDGANEEYDPVMLKYVPELKKRIFK